MEQGIVNNLKVIAKSHKGYELEDEFGEIVLYPVSIVDVPHEIGDYVDVFIYKNSKNTMVATSDIPLVQCNEFGYLKVNEINDIGAFMDWGLEKDLFIPYSEQSRRMENGRRYPVYVFLDKKSDRLAGSTRINDFFEKEFITVEEGDEVDLLVYEFTDIGINVVINNLHKGLLYSNETYRHVKPGDKVKGYIKHIREDGKIDVSLQIQGFQNIEPSAKKILEELKRSNGFLDLNDKSDPLDISYALEMSKKTFKKSIGSLYKQRLIRIEEDGIYLVDK